MQKYQYFVGVDVSKDTLDFALVVNNRQELHLRTTNDAKGITKFIAQLRNRGVHNLDEAIFCMEHTGIYCNHLLSFLTEKGLSVWLESPVQIKKSSGVQRGKNDKVDAMRIALYAYRHRDGMRLWQAPRESLRQLRHLTGVRNRLLKTIGILARESSEKEFYPAHHNEMTHAHTKASLEALRLDLKGVDKAIAKIIRDDERLNHLFKLVSSVHGIGKVTAIQIIIATNEFRNVKDAKKFACYCGVAPFEHTSGTSIRGRTRVSKMADMGLKKSLHMAALSAIHYSSELQDYFNRKVAGGKNKMSVINAVRNKLILRIFACVRDDRPYEREYVYLHS